VAQPFLAALFNLKFPAAPPAVDDAVFFVGAALGRLLLWQREQRDFFFQDRRAAL